MPVSCSGVTKNEQSFSARCLPDMMLGMATETALVVYTRPDCLYSEALIRELVRDGVKFKEIDLSLYPELAEEAAGLAGGERVTPVMVDGDKVTVGYRGISCAY